MPIVKIKKATTPAGKQIELVARNKSTGRTLKVVVARKDAKPKQESAQEKKSRHYAQLGDRLGKIAQAYGDCQRVVVEVPFGLVLPDAFGATAVAGISSPALNGFLKSGYELVISGHMSYSLLGVAQHPELELGFAQQRTSIMVGNPIDARKIIRVYGQPRLLVVRENTPHQEAFKFLLWYYRQIGWARTPPAFETQLYCGFLDEHKLELLQKSWHQASQDWPAKKAK